MRRFLGLLLVFATLACQTANDGTIKITGKIENAIPQGEVILEKYQAGEIAPVQTVYSDHEGNFEIETTVEGAGFYRLNVYGQQFETIVLDKDDLKVTASGQGGDEITVTGSDDMDYIDQLYAYLDGYQTTVQDFNQKYIQARNDNNTEEVARLTEEGMALEREKVSDLKALAWSMEGSIVPLLITDFITNKADEFTFLDSLANQLITDHPLSTDVQFFVNNLSAIKPAVAMGDIALEIESPNPAGENMKLSDLRGKYVLVDFWAGWCRPCRAENPNIVRMYNKYNEKGFEVFSVSLDRTRKQWVDAIEKDGLTWSTHVSDLKYFQGQAALDYKVNAIPFALLLDPEGRVIGKNLRGRMLQAKLESIFGQ